VHRGEVNWIVEAAISSFFDSWDRAEVRRMREVRVADGSLLRLIGKCLHVGVLEGVELSTSETGAAQGSVLSPLLGNVYLHYVLDVWFEQEVKPRLRGRATLIRYCDDFIIGFEHEDDARRVMGVLGKRLGRFGLALHPDKTRLISFPAPAGEDQARQGSGDLRLPGLHALLGAQSQGTLGDVLQDSQCEPETDHRVHLRLVSSPSTSSDQDTARSAHEAHPGPLQLFRCERQLQKSAARHRTGEAVLVQMALPSESA